MFTPWIKSLLEAASPRVIVEVGVAAGDTTVELLEIASRCDGTVHAIDPSPDPQFSATELKRRYGNRLVFHQTLSLNALGEIKEADAVVIDGDHNWYTVYNELKLLGRGGARREPAVPYGDPARRRLAVRQSRPVLRPRRRFRPSIDSHTAKAGSFRARPSLRRPAGSTTTAIWR